MRFIARIRNRCTLWPWNSWRNCFMCLWGTFPTVRYNSDSASLHLSRFTLIKMKHLLSWCNKYIRTSSPLFFQWQGGVHGAGLGFRAAAGGRRWQQGWQRGSQNLLGPAFLPPMLMLMLGWWMLGLSSECRVRRLIFGGAIRAVKLC